MSREDVPAPPGKCSCLKNPRLPLTGPLAVAASSQVQGSEPVSPAPVPRRQREGERPKQKKRDMSDLTATVRHTSSDMSFLRS